MLRKGTWLIGGVLLVFLLSANAGCDDIVREAAYIADSVADELDDLADDLDHRHHRRHDGWFDDLIDDIEDWFD